MGRVRSDAGSTAGSLGGISGAAMTAATALGDLASKGLQSLASGVSSLATNIFNSTGQMQQMEVGLESLIAREMARGTTIKETTYVQAAANKQLDAFNGLTEKEWGKYNNLLDSQRKVNHQLETYEHNLTKINDKTKDAAWKTSDLNFKIDEQKRKLGNLDVDLAKYTDKMTTGTKATGGMVAVTKEYTVGQMSLAEALPKATGEAKKMMEELANLAILSPYQVETVQNTNRLALAFGYSYKESVEFTRGMLEMAAGVGADNSMLERMAYNFAQIRLVGKVTQADVRQLAQAGFGLMDVLKYVGKESGVTVTDLDSFNSALASGKITWEQFTTDFVKYADENFGGASERMSRTLLGLQSTMKDVFILTMPKIFTPAAEKVTEFANRVLNDFLRIRNSGKLEEWGQSLGDSVGGALERIGAAYDKAKEFFFGPAVNPPSVVPTPSFNTPTFSVTPIGPEVPTGYERLAGAVKELGDAISGKQTDFNNLSYFVTQITAGIDQSAKDLPGQLDGLTTTITGWMDSFSTQDTTGLDTLGGKISKSVDGWMDAVGPAIDRFVSQVGGRLWTALGQMLTQGFQNFIQHPFGENGQTWGETFSNLFTDPSKALWGNTPFGTGGSVLENGFNNATKGMITPSGAFFVDYSKGAAERAAATQAASKYAADHGKEVGAAYKSAFDANFQAQLNAGASPEEAGAYATTVADQIVKQQLQAMREQAQKTADDPANKVTVAPSIDIQMTNAQIAGMTGASAGIPQADKQQIQTALAGLFDNVEVTPKLNLSSLTSVSTWKDDYSDQLAGVGSAITQGIASPIGKDNAIENALKNNLKTAIDGGKTAIEAKSPSKLSGREIGTPIVLGIEQNINDNMPKVESALMGVVTAIMNVAGPAIAAATNLGASIYNALFAAMQGNLAGLGGLGLAGVGATGVTTGTDTTGTTTTNNNTGKPKQKPSFFIPTASAQSTVVQLNVDGKQMGSALIQHISSLIDEQSERDW